jgi:hypothetical protein
MFGSFAALGAKVVGIPRLADGPDIARLAELAALHKPKLYIINSVLHNPSSTSLSAAKAFQVLRLAENTISSSWKTISTATCIRAARCSRPRGWRRWTSCSA